MPYVFAILVLAAASELRGEHPPDFRQNVRPLLEKRCFSCHGPEKARGGLRLDTEERAHRGGDRGAALVPGDSEGSLLIWFIEGRGTGEELAEELLMPPEGGRLSKEEIRLLRDWIDDGASYGKTEKPARGLPATPPRPLREPEKKPTPLVPLVLRAPLPKVLERSWPRTRIDVSLLARLEAAGLRPSPPAPFPTLVRRVWSDLLDTPAPPELIRRLGAAPRADALGRVVDRLLAAPDFDLRVAQARVSLRMERLEAWLSASAAEIDDAARLVDWLDSFATTLDHHGQRLALREFLLSATYAQWTLGPPRSPGAARR